MVIGRVWGSTCSVGLCGHQSVTETSPGGMRPPIIRLTPSDLS